MKTPAIVVFALLLILSLAACGDTSGGDAGAPAMATKTVEGPCPSLVGSWELVSIADDAPALQGSDTDPVYQLAKTLKILNETHWMFIRQLDDDLIHAQGGRYTLEPGGFYTESVGYSALPSNIGKNFTFECQLEGDSLWHHIGGLGDARYNEVWRRVE